MVPSKALSPKTEREETRVEQDGFADGLLMVPDSVCSLG